jgi:hypothetical protein
MPKLQLLASSSNSGRKRITTDENMTRQTEQEQIAAAMAAFTPGEVATPYRDEIAQILTHTKDMSDGIFAIIQNWKKGFLAQAQPHDKSNPVGQDYENYSKPIIVPTEMLRRAGLGELAHRLYEIVIRITDQHCRSPGPDLHRGALYANFGITNLEQGHFEIGLSWLLAAANEDIRFNRIHCVEESYAWDIYGQWVNSTFLKMLPRDALSFVSNRLGTTIGSADLMEMLSALAGNGDLNLLRGVVEYETVRGRSDYMGHAVRFGALRDLATLFEVLLKRIGENHVDPNVQFEFAASPMLGNIVHYMHYTGKPSNPSTTYKEGLFWNSISKQTNELEGIKAGFDFVKDFATNSISDVHTYISSTTLLDAARADEEAVAKRILVAYRLRNETSHSYIPEDPGMIAHADELRLWLLQAIFYSYFWFTRTGQVTL